MPLVETGCLRTYYNLEVRRITGKRAEGGSGVSGQMVRACDQEAILSCNSVQRREVTREHARNRIGSFPS